MMYITFIKRRAGLHNYTIFGRDRWLQQNGWLAQDREGGRDSVIFIQPSDYHTSQHKDG